MMPNTSVRPLATRNSSRPYCSAFSVWIRKVAKSITNSGAAGMVHAAGGQDQGTRRPRAPLARLHLAAACRVGEALDRGGHDLVLRAFGLAQIDVLHRGVRLRQGEGAARA